ncbi:M48 family metallopeptidase (plasmid) [Embleya sp. NBC_00888]|uniref:M48 family metallopeptidase n=1 Tax=Embleya sp. NBC_00888 TaxID=2975960 RepID=UPI002F91BB94|nr:M48 family metallopeptidase [Embleya sp. NBC_00888]
METRNTSVENAKPCPDCGADMPVEARFVTWCARCDWNVDPGGREPGYGRIEELRRRSARLHAEQLFADVLRDSAARPRRDGYAVLAFTTALAVHGITLGLAVGGLLLVVLGWSTGVQPVLGVVLLLAALTLRPRLGALDKNVSALYRADAPQLFALIDEVAAATDTTGVHVVEVDADVNASVRTFGLRQRRVLRLGLGLWEILTPRQRVALLGHELAHYANGDSRHGLVVGNALRSLDGWRYLLAPSGKRGPAGLVDIVLFPPRAAVHGMLTLLDHLTLRATQRAEYLADRTAARVASSAAVVELLDRLLVGGSVRTELHRRAVAANTRGRPGTRRGETVPEHTLWEDLAAHIARIPEREYERLRRVAALRGHSVDATHPPTRLRRRHALEGERFEGVVPVDERIWAAVAAELADVRAATARRIIRDRVDRPAP